MVTVYNEHMMVEAYIEDPNGTSASHLSGYGTIKFIEAVRNRPEVWDSRSTEYKLKDVKQQAWKCIATVMDPSFHSLNPTEQNLAVHGWMRRWKSLRDCYTREVGRNAGKKKKYIYFDHLLFLNEVIGSKRYSYHRLREKAESMSDEYTEEIYSAGDLWTGKQEYLIVRPEESPDDYLSLHELAATHRAHQIDEDDEQPQPVAVFSIGDDEDESSVTPSAAVKSSQDDSNQDDCSNERVTDSPVDHDADRMFLLSLVHDLRRIPSHKKLLVKSKILSLIQESME